MTITDDFEKGEQNCPKNMSGFQWGDIKPVALAGNSLNDCDYIRPKVVEDFYEKMQKVHKPSSFASEFDRCDIVTEIDGQIGDIIVDSENDLNLEMVDQRHLCPALSSSMTSANQVIEVRSRDTQVEIEQRSDSKIKSNDPLGLTTISSQPNCEQAGAELPDSRTDQKWAQFRSKMLLMQKNESIECEKIEKKKKEKYERKKKLKEKLNAKGKIKSDLNIMFSRLTPKSELPDSEKSPKKSNALGHAQDDGHSRNAADGIESVYCQAQTSGYELSQQDFMLTSNKEKRSAIKSESNTIDKIGNKVCTSPENGAKSD